MIRGVQGGIPLYYQGHVVGAIGVSGAKPEIDKAIAVKGIENIKGLQANKQLLVLFPTHQNNLIPFSYFLISGRSFFRSRQWSHQSLDSGITLTVTLNNSLWSILGNRSH